MIYTINTLQDVFVVFQFEIVGYRNISKNEMFVSEASIMRNWEIKLSPILERGGRNNYQKQYILVSKLALLNFQNKCFLIVTNSSKKI